MLDRNKILSKIIVTSMLAGTVGYFPAGAMAETFNLPSDLDNIKTQGEKDAIKYLYEMNKLSGYEDGTFRPGNQVTRAEFMAMLLNTMNYSETNVDVEFADVKTGDWYYGVLKQAYGLNLLAGKGILSDGRVVMSPKDVITREEMMTILVRAYEASFGEANLTETEENNLLDGFTDKGEIPGWAKTSVAKALKLKITSGVASDRLGIGENGNRLQSAVFSYRLLKEVEAKVPTDGSTDENTDVDNALVGIEPGKVLSYTEFPWVTDKYRILIESTEVGTQGYTYDGDVYLDKTQIQYFNDIKGVWENEKTLSTFWVKNKEIVVQAGNVYEENGEELQYFTFTYNEYDGAIDTQTISLPRPLIEQGVVEDEVPVEEETQDTIAPVITLKGESEITLNVGDVYIEAGVTATDDVDGDISANYSVEGTVDTSNAGVYQLAYFVTDAAGNTSNTLTRTVNVVEEQVVDLGEKPVISLYGDGTVYLNVGDVYVEHGAYVSDVEDGNSENVIINGSVDVDNAGTYIITYNFSDSDGNDAETVSRTIVVQEDAVAPVLTLNGSETVTMYVGDNYVDEGAVALDNVDGDISPQVIVNQSQLDMTTPGTYMVKYNVEDAAGNSAIELTRTIIVKENIVSLNNDSVYIKDSSVAIDNVKNSLVEKYFLDLSDIYVVKTQDLDDGLGADYKVEDVQNLVVKVNYGQKSSPEEERPFKSVYDVIVDNNINEIVIDDKNKTVMVKQTHTLKEIKNAFEVNAQSVIGANEVEFYAEQPLENEFRGDMYLFTKDENNEIDRFYFDNFVFGDSLNVAVGMDTLSVSQQKYEEMVDLYKHNVAIDAWEKVQFDIQIGIDGTYVFEDLSAGKYKVVLQPSQLTGEEYTNEYNKRLANETKHVILPSLDTEVTSSGALKLMSNLSSFEIDGTQTFGTGDAVEADIVSEEKLIAGLTDGVNGIYAEMIYRETDLGRVDKINLQSVTVDIGTETVDEDNDPATPDVVYDTFKLNPVADYTYFELGEKFDFELKLSVKDASDAASEEVATTIIPMTAEVVQNVDRLEVRVTLR